MAMANLCIENIAHRRSLDNRRRRDHVLFSGQFLGPAPREAAAAIARLEVEGSPEVPAKMDRQCED